MEIGSIEWKGVILEGARQMGIPMDPGVPDLFAVHAAELIRWNRKTNLTALADPLDMAIQHFLDSAVAAPFVSPGSRMLDIGSGGGFPGIPLKVMIPSLSVLVIDGVRKKVSFLSHVIRILGLNKIEAQHVRAEDLATDPASFKGFDVIISRALSGLDTFVGYALPLMAPGGKIISMRGRAVDEDLDAIQPHLAVRSVSNGSDVSLIPTIHSYRLPHLSFERSLVILKQA
jgi:16S rRNA (guanine527-N7)-methyltransferase